MRKFYPLVVAALMLASPALAQHKHGETKGPNGGPVEDVAGVHAEFVANGAAVTFNILDENNKPLPVKGYVGSVLIVSGSERETVQLTAGDSALKGEAKRPIPAGARVTLQLKNQVGKSGQAQYKN